MAWSYLNSQSDILHAGVMVIGEINHRTAHLMNILWLVGTFTFAIVLGVVTEDIVNHVVVSLPSYFSISSAEKEI